MTTLPDIKHLLSNSEYGSVSSTRKTETDLCLDEDMFRGFKLEENDRQHHLGKEDMPVFLVPNVESKSLNTKSLKKLTNFPSSKRPRREQQNDPIMTAKVDNYESTGGEFDHVRGIFDGKSSNFLVKLHNLFHQKKRKKKLYAMYD